MQHTQDLAVDFDTSVN